MTTPTRDPRGRPTKGTPADFALRKKRLEAKLEKLTYELPHIYKFKWYKWAKAFYDSRNRINMLTAANQISKSTTLQRKDTEWLTNKKLWPELWPANPEVRQFWYLYPSKDVATAEFHTKILLDVMPKVGKVVLEKGKEKCEDSVYGWQANYFRKQIYSIDWASGVTQFYKSYTQDVHTLQTGTVHKVSCDEELPEELFQELMFRLEGTDGYFDIVFTATRNQLFWLLCMEAIGTPQEKLPQAFKQTISMYDCQVYTDGTPGRYHDTTKIDEAKARCKNDQEVQRRVYGRFISDTGRKYPQFDPVRHFVKPFPIPSGWMFYGGIDPGSGGTNHPTGLGILAVNPDMTKGYVIDGWRGDNVETTAGDSLAKFIEVRGNRKLLWQVFDQTDKDFYHIAMRQGEPFIKAEKSHELGESIVNTLFKNDMLFIFDLPELAKLGTELMTLMSATPKQRAKDDFIDGALRYPCVLIPWDWSAIKTKTYEDGTPLVKEVILNERDEYARSMRNRGNRHSGEESWQDLDAEIEFWNELYG